MKKYILLLLAAVCTSSAMAQTEVIRMKTTDNKVLTYDVKQIEEVTFSTLLHSYDGYVTANARFFQDRYFGGIAKLSVWRDSEENLDTYLSDPVWGDASFYGVSMAQGQLSGTGTMTVGQGYGGGTFEATISGPMSKPVVTVAMGTMGDVALTFNLGEPTVDAVLPTIVGTHNGVVKVDVAGETYTNNAVAYQVTANADNTVNIVVPAFDLPGTMMGDLSLGSFTISNAAYDGKIAGFARDYKGDGVKMHLKAVKDGETTMDSDYAIEQIGNIEVKFTSEGLTIVNNFQPGRMPYPITSTFVKSSSH